jgi:hypothetical protein
MYLEQNMFNPAIIKKKKDTEAVKVEESAAKHALKSMAPKMEDEEEEGKEESIKKAMKPESKLEIEIMLQAAKKKKK